VVALCTKCIAATDAKEVIARAVDAVAFPDSLDVVHHDAICSAAVLICGPPCCAIADATAAAASLETPGPCLRHAAADFLDVEPQS